MANMIGQFRQTKSDRRKHDRTGGFPFMDREGVIVRADRRLQSDRRVHVFGVDKGVVEHIEF